jgi:hypothetical protein
MDAARQSCRVAPVQGPVEAHGESAVMWRVLYFWIGLLVARYLFRRPTEQIDLDRLRSAGF